MSLVLAIWVLVNLALFAVLLAYAWQLQQRWRSTSIRFIAVALALVAGTFLVSSIQRLGIQAARAGLIDATWEDFFLTQFQVVLSLVGTVAGLYTVIWVRSGMRHLEAADRMLSALTEKVPGDMDASKWELTAREYQVLETIVSGKTSDEEIAETLYISAATAGTHVRNILRKTGMSSRMDLMLAGGRHSRPRPRGFKRGDRGG